MEGEEKGKGGVLVCVLGFGVSTIVSLRMFHYADE